MNVARQTEKALDNGDYTGASYAWDRAEGEVGKVTDGIDFYNILTKISRQKIGE